MLQGNEVMPLITSSEETARAGVQGKIRSVKIQVDDADLVNFITGGYVVDYFLCTTLYID